MTPFARTMSSGALAASMAVGLLLAASGSAHANPTTSPTQSAQGLLSPIVQPIIKTTPTAAPNDALADLLTPPAPPQPGVLIQTASPVIALVVALLNGVTIVDGDVESGVYQLTVPLNQTPLSFVQTLLCNLNVITAELDLPIGLAETDGQAGIHLAFDRTATLNPPPSNSDPGSDPGSTGADSSGSPYQCIADSPWLNYQAYQQVNLGTVQSITKGAGITIAVLDTGVMTQHPDLKSHLVTGFNTFQASAAPEDIADGTTNNAWGHGTFVTGIITRLAPDAKVMPIRVLNGDGSGKILNAIRGIEYGVDHGARVLNMSLDASQYSPLLNMMTQWAISRGVVVVAAAGNQGTGTPHYPAAFPGVIGVASVESNDSKSDFSNFSYNSTLAAPGVAIRSTYINGGYASWTGTSFSAPFVSAAAAMTLAASPSLTGQQAATLLKNTGRSIDAQNPAYIGQIGYGELNIARLVFSAISGQ